jgi:hypothetical protein
LPLHSSADVLTDVLQQRAIALAITFFAVDFLGDAGGDLQ